MTDEIWRLDSSRTRSVSAENPTGAPGAGGRATEGTGAVAARELGRGWKVSPSIDIAAGQTATLMDVAGQGVLRHLWLTTDRTVLRSMLLRIYWDGESEPAVDLSLAEFFCNAWDELALFDSEMIVVAPAGGLNSYWPMPFRSGARMTLHNAGERTVPVYYQATYTEAAVPDNAGRLHVRSRRSAPLGDPAVHTILDGVQDGVYGHGRYVGTYLAIRPGASGWWGEGEVKFYLDGDTEFPTVCGTGTEDYFGGAWNFDVGGRYHRYAGPYLGLHQVLPPDEIYGADQRLGMYRWHVRDPICFDREVRVTIQALGWQEGTRYRPLTDADITTTAFWYQAG